VARVDVAEDVKSRFYPPDLGEQARTAEGGVEVVGRGRVGYEDVGGDGDAVWPGRGRWGILEAASVISVSVRSLKTRGIETAGWDVRVFFPAKMWDIGRAIDIKASSSLEFEIHRSIVEVCDVSPNELRLRIPVLLPPRSGIEITIVIPRYHNLVFMR